MDDEQLFLEEVMENYKSPKNFKKLENYDLLQHQKNISCGDTFDLYIKLDESKNKILEIGFYGEGCAISTASFSMLTSMLKGMTVEDAKKLTQNDIYEMLGIKISPGKMNCALLSLKALHNALENSK